MNEAMQSMLERNEPELRRSFGRLDSRNLLGKGLDVFRASPRWRCFVALRAVSKTSPGG